MLTLTEGITFHEYEGNQNFRPSDMFYCRNCYKTDKGFFVGNRESVRRHSFRCAAACPRVPCMSDGCTKDFVNEYCMMRHMWTHHRYSPSNPPTSVDIETFYPHFPVGSKKFELINLDVPYKYKNYAVQGAAENHYRTIPTDILAHLPVKSIAARSCVLCMWASGPTLEHALFLIKHWGFEYVTVLSEWS